MYFISHRKFIAFPIINPGNFFNPAVSAENSYPSFAKMPPSEFTFKILKENEMTIFIREPIVKNNPFYTTDMEPSRWSAARLIFATGFPIMLYANYLMRDAMPF